MSEIKKIIEFIESHKDTLAYEFLGNGNFVTDVTYTLNDTDPKDVILKVKGKEEDGRDTEIFTISESWFELPNKEQINEIIKANDCGEYNDDIGYHWTIVKLPGDIEQLVISHLSLQNYLKAIEIYTKNK